MNRHGTGPQAPLSPVQADVLALVARGLTHAEIGEQLGMSERMSKYWVLSLRRVAGVERKSQLVAWAQDRQRRR